MELSETNIRRKKENLQKAIKDGGFYGKNGKWNSIKTFPGDKTVYRHRVETIIIKNNKSVFLKKKFDGTYRLPGGSTEKDVPNIDQAINECQEEAHIKIRNIESTGITYKEKHDPPAWAKAECDVEWNGSYTEIYVAEYDGPFEGHIDKDDEDPYIRSGAWYATKDCFSFFRKEHREALLWFIKNHQDSSNENDEEITESYISNYFANKKLLKKISHNPDIERSSVEHIISILKKEYSEMIGKSKIQREMKRKDVESIFHPILSFDFPDKSTITIALCFDTSSFTDGAAIHTDEYGDIVLIYPSFFKETKESQIFTILHEFGHIRLDHLSFHNNPSKLFAKNNDEYRQKIMNKGKSMYPEVNADLYAVLNGASMYSILGSSISKDYDDQYDYRFTNAELSSRYNGVFNQYKKLKKFQEGDNSFMAFSVTKYDLACTSLYEMVYLNEQTENLTSNEKDILYSLMYEAAINKYIKNEPYVIKAEKEYEEASENYSAKKSIFNKYKNICDMKQADLSKDDLNFKIEIETDMIEGIPRLEHDVYNLQSRFENAGEGLMYARSKAYNDYANTLEKASCIISPTTIKNEKSVILASEKLTLEETIHEIADSLVESYYEKTKMTESVDDSNIGKYIYLIESLTTKERNAIPIEKFGIPEKRAYPLDTKKHVHSAIALFGHCELEYREELAKNILKAMAHYKMSTDIIGEKSKIREYM